MKNLDKAIAKLFDSDHADIEALDTEGLKFRVTLTAVTSSPSVNFKTMMELSKLLGTELINVHTQYDSDGCESCGYGETSLFLLYVTYEDANNPFKKIADETRKKREDLEKQRAEQMRIAKEAAAAAAAIRQQERLDKRNRRARREAEKAAHKQMIEEAMKNHKPNAGAFINTPDDLFPWNPAGSEKGIY